MMLQLRYPSLDPVLHLGPVAVRWYALMYVVSFIIAFFVLRHYARSRNLEPFIEFDLVLYLIIGVVAGARLGYVLFYNLSGAIHDYTSILAIRQGGMSFHGGFIGVILMGLWICRKKGWRFLEIADFVCVAFPIGLGLGRIGNFINGELYGRPTSLPWGMIFPRGGDVPRHPSQIYEAAFEGLLLFLILNWLYRKNLQYGTVFWAFMGLYGLFRFSLEFLREPDIQIGMDLGPFTRGQLLSFPMMVVGLTTMALYSRRGRRLTG